MSCLDSFCSIQPTRYDIVEGSVSKNQSRWLVELLQRHTEVKEVLEIGFNGGLSCASMLSARSDISVTSFDLGSWPYVYDAAKLIGEMFPGRHSITLGDSTKTLPNVLYRQFDLVFLDGGHGTPVPQHDIRNALQVLKPGGLLVMDDYCAAYGIYGVIEAYDEAVLTGVLVTVSGPHSDGDRGWIVGQKPV